jgi:Cys-rich protein (TIGR01571 family)
VTGLFDCFCHPWTCLAATFFTPILAAFNRAEAENRDCSACDVCFSVKPQLTTYHTRQSIRSANGLQTNEVVDAVAACCCTPCAVAQDTLELERREALNALPGTQMEVIAAVPVGTVAVAAPPSYEKLPPACQV